jgi:hypothetical protein
MAEMMTLLETLRDKLATVVGVQTCKIGMEANLTPEDYPIVRIVPSNIRQKNISMRECDLIVYFGKPIHEFTAGLEALYDELFTMESELLAACRTLTSMMVIYDETLLDEDRVDAYKLMALRLSIAG